MYPSEDSTPLIGDSSRPAVATDAGPAAREDDHGAAAPGDAAAGGAVDHHHRGAARSSAGLIHHASVDGDRPDTTLNEDKSMTEASARPAQVANGQTDAGRTSAEDVKDSSTIPAAGPAVAAAPAINGKKLRAQKTVSRPASPAITSDGLASLENDDTGDVSFASTSSYAATPSRPTRRAAAKVAARGSYYSPSAFVMQGPQQAVQDASAAERNGHRSSAGAENSSSVQTSAVTSHDSTAGDIKGKAKANGVPLTASEDTQVSIHTARASSCPYSLTEHHMRRLPTCVRSTTTTTAPHVSARAISFAVTRVRGPFTLPASIRLWTSTQSRSMMIRPGTARSALRSDILHRRPRRRMASSVPSCSI